MIAAPSASGLTHKVVFTNFSGNDKYKDKAQRVKGYLSNHRLIASFIDQKDVCRISFNKEFNPAWVSYGHADRNDIELSTWYFENRSTGYLMGMLCHEFGVHPIPDMMVADEDTVGANEEIRTGLDDKVVTIGAADQQDHIFASVPGYMRYAMYLDVVTQMAVLLKDDTTPSRFGTVVADLLDCYLMDIASILATNDHRAKGIFSLGDVAAYYNHHLPLAVNNVNAYGLDARYTASLKPKSKFNIFCDYGGVLGDLAKGAVDGSSMVKKK